MASRDIIRCDTRYDAIRDTIRYAIRCDAMPWMDGSMDGWMDGSMDRWMDGMDGRWINVDRWVHEWVNKCISGMMRAIMMEMIIS